MTRRTHRPWRFARHAALALAAPLISPTAAADVVTGQVMRAAGELRAPRNPVGSRADTDVEAIVWRAFVPVGAITSDLDAIGGGAQRAYPAPGDIPAIGGVDVGSDETAKRVMQMLVGKRFDEALAASNELIRSAPKSPVGYNLQGAAYLGKQDATKARGSFEQALRHEANYVPALMNLAQLDVRQRNLPAARSRYQSILAIDGKNLPAMLGMAQLEVVDGKEPAARDWLERAKREQPKALPPRLLLAFLDIRARQFATAVTELKAAREVAPQAGEVLLLLGHAQASAGDNAEAAETYKAFVAMRPKSSMGYVRLADSYARLGNLNLAENALKQGLQAVPGAVDATAALAYLQLKTARYAEASQLVEKLRKTSPAEAAALNGDIFAQQQRYREAAASYAQAFALAPASGTAAKLHLARMRSGEAKQADEDIERWLRQHPRDIAIRRYLAATAIKAGRSRDAVKQYEAIVDIDPRDIEALNNLAILYQADKDSRSLATAEKAYQLAPGSAVVADTLGWVLVNRGDAVRGLPLLRTAATGEPKNPEIQYHLAFALAGAGQRSEAKRALEAILATDVQFPQRADALALLKTL